MKYINFKNSFLLVFMLTAVSCLFGKGPEATIEPSLASESKVTDIPEAKKKSKASSPTKKDAQVEHVFTQNHAIKAVTQSTEKKHPEDAKVADAAEIKTETKSSKVDSKKRVPLDPTKTTSAARRKHQSLYKKKKVTMSYMSLEEMEEAKNQRIKDKNLEAAIKYVEKMLPLCKDMHKQKDLTLELADLLFDNAQLEKAGKIYQEFIKLYPGTAAIEHASYRAILCSFYGILDSQRDQTKTQETISLTTAFLERSEIFTERNEEVLSIQKKCYERLVESEMNVLEYYLNNERFNAAQVRVDGLRKDYGLKMVDLEPKLLTIEIVMAEKQGKPELAEEKRLALHDKYPTFSEVSTVIAQAKENSFVDKF